MFLSEELRRAYEVTGGILAGEPGDEFIIVTRDYPSQEFRLFVAAVSYDEVAAMLDVKVTPIRAEARVFSYTHALDVAGAMHEAKVVPR